MISTDPFVVSREMHELKAFFERFTFKYPFMGGVIQLTFDVTPHGDLAIIIPMQVPDRDTGASTVVTFGSTLSFVNLHQMRILRSEAQFTQYVHRTIHEAIRRALLHEVDEMLCFDGKVFDDPHAKEAVHT